MSLWKDEDIRRMFMGENVARSNDRSDAEMKEFDRWLVAHDKRVAKKTEQRIIKLLDKAKTYQQLERAIAAIKGEK